MAGVQPGTGLPRLWRSRLRKKVDQTFGVRLIHTIRGVGFTMKEGEP